MHSDASTTFQQHFNNVNNIEKKGNVNIFEAIGIEMKTLFQLIDFENSLRRQGKILITAGNTRGEGISYYLLITAGNTGREDLSYYLLKSMI